MNRAAERQVDYTIRPVVERANRTLSCSFCGFAVDLSVKSEQEFQDTQAKISHKCPQPILSNVSFDTVVTPLEPTPEVISDAR